LKHYPLFDVQSRELIHGSPRTILGREDFEDYQAWMATKAVRRPFVYLAAEPGLGKTGTSLYAITKWLERGIAKKPLIIAPKYVANHTWPDEVAVWDFARGLRYSVITGTPEQRMWAATRDADFYVINRENLRWLYEQFPGLRFVWDACVYDEASRLKSGKKRTKPAPRKDGTVAKSRLSEYGVLCKMRRRFQRTVLLSGTPAPNGIEDLWGPTYFLDGGQRLGKTKTAFLRRWFSHNEYTHQWTPHSHSKAEILHRIKDIFFALRSEDYLTLPDLVIKDRMVDLEPKAREAYDRMEREFLLEEHDIEAVNSAVLINKLLQLANGSIYNEDRAPVRIHNQKLDMLESIVEEAGGRPLLVAYSYGFDLEEIKKKFRYARVFGERDSDVADWNAGKIRMLLVHPASAGHGLNFQYGSNICVWYGLNWSLELYQQFIKRLHRRGQKHAKVFMYRILARGTADTRVVEVLDHKDAEQTDVMNAVRVRV